MTKNRRSTPRGSCAIALWALTLLSTLLLAQLSPAAAGPPVSVVEAPASPVKLSEIKLLNTDAAPFVLLYGATNLSPGDIEQFTVTVFVFDKDRRLKARQVAPGRRTLKAQETKFSAMVLDVGAIDAGDALLVGVDQAQKVDSDDWWQADLRTIAESVMNRK